MPGPGSGSGAGSASPAPVDIEDPEAVLRLARALGADLTVVGPEAPLASGVADTFTAAGLQLFGPGRDAARIEASKVFAKDFMVRHGIPTAAYEVADDPAEARTALDRFGTPVVVKADGLAAGKGVTVAADMAQAEAAVRQAMEEEAFGEAGRRVIIEECLEGQEVSVLALTDGETVVTFPPAQDHKRVFDGDRGPNTGGMGAYAPAPVLGAEEQELVMDRILLPTVRGLAAEGVTYRGVLYAGLILTPEGPKVLEFNCRFGDPETQVILPLLQDDLVELMLAVATGELGSRLGRTPVGRGTRGGGEGLPGLALSGESAVSVVMASGGYPGPYEKGKVIHGLEAAARRPGVKVFHAGTRLMVRDEDGGVEGTSTADGDSSASGVPCRVVTAGGRVLNITATASTLAAAAQAAYQAASLIRFEGAHYRSDIAAKALWTSL